VGPGPRQVADPAIGIQQAGLFLALGAIAQKFHLSSLSFRSDCSEEIAMAEVLIAAILFRRPESQSSTPPAKMTIAPSSVEAPGTW
ncbi:hypothetical protein OO18_29550, partial [Raoultella ornithinolytica]